jgi:hypothetical protein
LKRVGPAKRGLNRALCQDDAPAIEYSLVQQRAFDPELRFAQRFDHAVDRGGVTRFALDLDQRVLGRQGGEDPLMVNLDDVDPMLQEAFSDADQHARPVGGEDREPHSTVPTLRPA